MTIETVPNYSPHHVSDIPRDQIYGQERKRIMTSWLKNCNKFANLNILFCGSMKVFGVVVDNYCCGELNE